MIAGEIFKNTSFFSLIVNIFLLIYANLLVKRGYFQLKLMRWFLLLAVALTLVGTFIIQPMMEEWREIALNEGAPVMQSPYAAKFGLFHHISSVMFTFEVFISFWVFWVSTRLKKSYPN